MKQANFKNVKVGERFIAQDGKRYVKIRPCWIESVLKNAVSIPFGHYYTFGNGAVSILEDDEA